MKMKDGGDEMGYVVVGSGVAGTTAVEEIRKRDKEGKITLFTEEDLPFYWRIRLIEYLAGELDEKGLLSKKEEWYRDQRVDLRLKTRIVGGDPRKKILLDEEGEAISYDKLLIATGSRSFVPPIQGGDKKGVFALRSIKDAREIAAWAKGCQEAVIIGGGLLGLEAGNSIRKRGVKVTVVEFFPRLLPRQLDVDGAGRLQTMMEGLGFSFRLGAKTEEILGDGKVEGVSLEGGERIPASMVIISAGVRPNLDLARAMGVETDKGIKINDRLQTNLQDIYAAGDVIEFKGMPYGIWPAALEQGKVAGINMAGGEESYQGTVMATTLKVVGIELASAGEIDVEKKFESKVHQGERFYKKIVLDGNRIIGCIMLGEKRGFARITRLMAEKRDVAHVKGEILSDGFDFNRV
jgi:nitrite reductase (NADH) large subunit